jgi:predicted dehydrogenase
MNTVRWGIIGCGNVTEVKSGPALQNAQGSSLVAVMRRNGALAEDYARRHGVPRWYDDADALLRDPDVDAVYIATPPSSHRRYTEMAAAHGKPIYVEKPMATTGPDCDAMRSACSDAGVPLFVAYYRRALPRFLQVREHLESGAIGEPIAVAVTHLSPPTGAESGELPGWRVSPEIAGGGYFVDLGSHTLDLLDFLLGPVERADGSAANTAGLYRAEDLVTARLTFASGVQGVGVWSFVAAEHREHVEIFGTHGTLRFSVFADVPVTLSRDGNEDALPFLAHPAHVQQPLIQSVVDALAGRGTCPSTGDSAARTSHVIDRLLADHRATLGTPSPSGEAAS